MDISEESKPDFIETAAPGAAQGAGRIVRARNEFGPSCEQRALHVLGVAAQCVRSQPKQKPKLASFQLFLKNFIWIEFENNFFRNDEMFEINSIKSASTENYEQYGRRKRGKLFCYTVCCERGRGLQFRLSFWGLNEPMPDFTHEN